MIRLDLLMEAPATEPFRGMSQTLPLTCFPTTVQVMFNNHAPFCLQGKDKPFRSTVKTCQPSASDPELGRPNRAWLWDFWLDSSPEFAR